MSFAMTFKTQNAAFDDGNGPEECAAILRRVAHRVAEGYTSGIIADSNGNTVGSWSVELPETED